MIHCPQCGYNLTGVCTPATPEATCPECGAACRYDHLLRTGGVEQTNLVWPIIAVVAGPVLVGALLVAGLAADSSGRGEPVAWLLMSLAGMLGLAAVGLAVFTARRMARRMAMRPKGSSPNSSSVAMTIAFSILFISCQACLTFCIFFFGCLAVVASY